MTAERRRIALIVFPGTKLMDVCGPLQVFSDANTSSNQSAYEVVLVSETGGHIATDAVCSIGPTLSFRQARRHSWDTVLLSGGDAAYSAARSERLRDFVKSASASCRRLGSVCLGAFVLASGGHLSGRRATTHWDGIARFSAEFPDITVEDDAIFVEDRGVWTSAGVTAGIDMALAMVEQDLGAHEALRLAKSLVLPVRRSGGQRQFSGALTAQASGVKSRFSALISDIVSDLRQDLTVPTLATKAGMSERNFSRIFVSEIGDSPARFVERLRVECACELLHETAMSLTAAQTHAGFANAEQMRRAFQRCKGTSPSEYQESFASLPGVS